MTATCYSISSEEFPNVASQEIQIWSVRDPLAANVPGEAAVNHVPKIRF